MVPLLRSHAFFPPLPWPLALSFHAIRTLSQAFFAGRSSFYKMVLIHLHYRHIYVRPAHANFDLSFS